MRAKTLARITGLGYLIIFFTGFFSNFYVLESLVNTEDSFITTANIYNQFYLFTYGLIGFVVMIVTDVLLAGPLYQLLKKTSQDIALLSSGLRMVNGTIFAVALFSLFEVSNLIKNGSGNPEDVYLQVSAALDTFQSMWSMALIFFGLHLLFLGYLLTKSFQFPSSIGVLLFIAGIGYLVDCFAQIGFLYYESYKSIFETFVIIPAVIGEFSLTLFLLIKGIRAEKGQALA